MKTDANSLGEHLRNQVFDGGEDCYNPPYCSQFTINLGWLPTKVYLPAAVMRSFMGDGVDDPTLVASVIHVYNEKLLISALWYSDGDCCLMFHGSDFTLINTDAKKSSYWVYVE